MNWYRLYSRVLLQVQQFRRNCHPNVPEWYETRRKTTMVVFWS